MTEPVLGKRNSHRNSFAFIHLSFSPSGEDQNHIRSAYTPCGKIK